MTSIQHWIRSLKKDSESKKGNKICVDWQGISKIVFIAVIYIKYHKEAQRGVAELMSEQQTTGK